MSNIIGLIREDLRAYTPYSSARDEAKFGSIWLNANESPYSFASYENIQLNRYPEKQSNKLLQQIATLYDVAKNQIVLTRGSDEAIDLLIRLFCSAGQDSIITCTPTYGMYSVSARLQGAKVIEVPLMKDDGYQLDISSIMSAWNPNTKIVFLCSPNNPTGNILRKEDILSLCGELSNKSLIVVDEAYIEFSATESLSKYINQHPNLVILRTLSKAYGLAGARFGFLFAQTELVQWVLKIIAPYPLASPIVQIALEALSVDRVALIQEYIQKTLAEKMRIVRSLQAMSFIKKILPSDANFILVEMVNAKEVMKRCSQQGIILRSMFDKVGLDNCIRISIGTAEENNQLLELLSSVE